MKKIIQKALISDHKQSLVVVIRDEKENKTQVLRFDIGTLEAMVDMAKKNVKP